MTEANPQQIKDYSVVGFLLRLPIGVLFLFAGIGKMVGGYGNFIGWIVKDMTEKTWLPKTLVTLYAYPLPFLEIGIGLFLVIGLFTRPALVAAGLLLTSLMFGKVLAQEHGTVANIANYILITALAYYFSLHNRFSIDAVRK